MPSLLKRSHSGARQSKRTEEWACEVKLLHDDKPMELKFHRDILGQGVLDQVCERLGNLEEKDYFGLQYAAPDNQKKWLDLRNPAYKQLKHSAFSTLFFRVKHYPPHPTDNLKQNLSKYLLYSQLKKDLLEGRLYSSSTNDSIYLAACIVQADYGDFDSFDGFEHRDYLSGVTLVHNQTPKMESLIYDQHIALKGKSAQEAETLFLERAFSLDTYGIDPKPVRDRNGNSLFLGLSYKAVVTFHGSKLTHAFPWESINSIRVQDKMLLLEINLSSTEEMRTAMADFKYKPRLRLPFTPKRHLLGFKCENKTVAAALWAASLEQQLFFTLNKGSEARVVKSNDGFLRRRRNSFRFSGRSQKELLSSSDYFLNLNQTAPPVVRLKRSDSLSSCPTVRRLPSVRKPLRNYSGSSDDSDVSSVSQSRRAQVNQAEAENKRDSRFATYPGRRRPEVDMEDEEQLQNQTLPHPPAAAAAADAAAVSDAAAKSAASTNVDNKTDSKADSVFDTERKSIGNPSSANVAAAAAPADTVDSELTSPIVATEDITTAEIHEEVIVEAPVEVEPELHVPIEPISSSSVESSPSPIAAPADSDNAGDISDVTAAMEKSAPVVEAEEVLEDVEESTEPPELAETAAVSSSSPPVVVDDSSCADTAVGHLDKVIEHHEEAEAAAETEATAAAVSPPNGNENGPAAAQVAATSSVAANRSKDRRLRQPIDEEITPVSRKQAALFLTAAFSLLALAGVVLFFEADLRSPAMRGLRQHPLVDEFFDRIYGPIRARLV